MKTKIKSIYVDSAPSTKHEPYRTIGRKGSAGYYPVRFPRTDAIAVTFERDGEEGEYVWSAFNATDETIQTILDHPRMFLRLIERTNRDFYIKDCQFRLSDISCFGPEGDNAWT